MRCQFCTQWNPDDASDCAFCGNDLRGALDATSEGRPAYESAPRGRGAATGPQAAAIVRSRRPDPGPIVSDGLGRGLVDVIGGRHRSVIFMAVAMGLAFLVYKLTEC